MANRLIQAVQMHIGPRGYQGPQGIQGIQGNVGPTGPQGPAGTGVFEYVTESGIDYVRYNSILSITNHDFIIPSNDNQYKMRLYAQNGSFGIGNSSTVTHNNSFVWSDSLSRTSITHNTVLFGAQNGFYVDVGSSSNLVGISISKINSTFGKIEPLVDDTMDLGSASLRFRDIYMGSNIFVSSNTTNALVIKDSNDNTLLTFDTTTNNRKILVNSPMLPSSNNTVDMGTASQSYRNLYFASGSKIIANNVDRFVFNASDTSFSTTIKPTLNGQYDIGATSLGFRNLYFATGSKIIANNTDRFVFNASDTRIANPFYPTANNTYNLGDSTIRWNTIFGVALNLSGAVSAASASFSGAVSGASATFSNYYGTNANMTNYYGSYMQTNNLSANYFTANFQLATPLAKFNTIQPYNSGTVIINNSSAVTINPSGNINLTAGSGNVKLVISPQYGFYPVGAALINQGSAQSYWNAVWSRTFPTGSDAQLKENITDITYGLSYIRNVRAVNFTYKNNPNTNIVHDRVHTGWIAQEILTGALNIGLTATQFGAYNEDPVIYDGDNIDPTSDIIYFCTDGKTRAIKPNELTAILWAAVRDLDQIVQTQQTTINSLISRIEALEAI